MYSLDEKLIYMDPHFCQDTVDVQDIECPLEVSDVLQKLPFYPSYYFTFRSTCTEIMKPNFHSFHIFNPYFCQDCMK